MIVKPFPFASSFIASALVHFAGFALAVGLLGQQSYRREGNPIPVSLLEPAPEEKPFEPVERKILSPPVKQPPQRPAKHETARAEESSFSRAKIEPSKVKEAETPPPPTSNAIPDSSADEGGGSATGVNNLAPGNIGVAPGSGSAGSGTGSAIAGLGRGSGAPGMPLQTGPLRTNREAKPLQTARAAYPPMALRMGLEGDVTLRIEVDPAGNVTRAEIIKSGGAAFDEEALKAVRQSRFEPAQKEGQNVAAEFNYVYRFRLQR